MSLPSDEWLDQQADRLISAQSARADTAKLIVTFSLGISAALLGAALQLGYTRALWWGIAFFVVSVLLSVFVFVMAEQLVQPDHDAVLADETIQDEAALMDGLRRAAFDAVETVRHVLTVLEQQLVVVTLLRDVLDRGLTVAIGSETGVEDLAECAIVVAPYEVEGEPVGTIGVLGPTRMNYAQTLAAVAMVSKGLGRRLSEGS